jgi:hypothetical protein
VKPDEEVAFISRFVLGDSAGTMVAGRIDSTIAKLPGMGWFDRLRLTREAALSPANRPGAGLGRSAVLANGRAQ